MSLPLLLLPSCLPLHGACWLAGQVYVDSFMDGLLIGISAVAGQNAGLIMTVALTIEMMFLGLTFSASLRHLPSLQRYGLVTGAPLMILVGGTVGAYAAALLSANPIVQIGLIAFGGTCSNGCMSLCLSRD